MHELKESDDPEFGTTFERAIFKPYTFKVRAKAETYNDETRVKCTIQVRAAIPMLA
jgi:replication factor A1